NFEVGISFAKEAVREEAVREECWRWIMDSFSIALRSVNKRFSFTLRTKINTQIQRLQEPVPRVFWDSFLHARFRGLLFLPDLDSPSPPRSAAARIFASRVLSQQD